MLSLAVLIYPVILIQNFPYNVQRFFTDMVFALLLGLLVSLIAFVGLHLFFAENCIFNATPAASS